MNRLQVLNWDKFLVNSLTFLAPVLLIYLVYLQGNIADGIAWADFVPTNFTLGSMVLYVVNVTIDFIKKFIAAGK